MSDIKVILTRDEIINSYHWNLLKRIMKSEFPFIIDMDVEVDNLNKYNLIFAEIIIDPFKFAEVYDTTLPRYTVWGLTRNERRTSPFVSSFFDLTYEQGKEIQKEMDDVMNSVEKSQALPDDLKLPKSRTIVTGDFIIPPNIEIPESVKAKYF